MIKNQQYLEHLNYIAKLLNDSLESGDIETGINANEKAAMSIRQTQRSGKRRN